MLECNTFSQTWSLDAATVLQGRRAALANPASATPLDEAAFDTITLESAETPILDPEFALAWVAAVRHVR
jgi:hypothetical protein